MRTNFLILLISMLTLTSCNKNRVYKKFIDIPKFEWLFEKPIEYSINFDGNDTKYDITVALRYAMGCPYREIPLSITTITPSGQEFQNDFIIKIRDDNDEYIGEGLGDLFDIERLVKSKVQFIEKGTYRFEIAHKIPERALLIMEVGLIIDKTKVKN